MRGCGLVTWTVACVLAVASQLEAAGAGKGRFRNRQGRQRARIKGGVKDKSLTPKETTLAVGQQRRIQRHGKQAASDGKVTPRERIRLEREQNRASRSIAKQRHDKQGEMGPKPKWKTWDPGVNRRQRNQRRRTGHGIHNGSLTKDEVKSLGQAERDLRKLEREYKSDGELTIDERKELHQELNELSSQIYDEKHDDEFRPKLSAGIRKKLRSEDLTGEDAKEIIDQARRLSEIKRTLGGNKQLTDAEREELESEFDLLYNNLFQ